MTAAIQNNESRWTVIANGKQIANGTTIRRNGKISHFVSRENFEKENVKKDEKLETNEQTVLTNYDNGEDFIADNTCSSEKNETKCPALKVNTSGIRAPNEALSTVIHQLRWRECKGNIKLGAQPADLYWHGTGFDEGLYNRVGVYAVNKLPGMVELSQKIHLSKIMKRMQMLFPGEFDFYPPTWFLPEQYHQFVAEVLTKGKGRSDPAPSTTPLPELNRSRKRAVVPTYIVKPDCGSQGEGIYLVNDPRDVQDAIGSKPAVVQKYIDDPLLLDNFKFDLRMYVTIARLHPVEIYLCKDGLARLCTVEYESPRPSNIHNSFMHLTNYSLNKYSDDFLLTNAEHTGSKRTYRGVRHLLQKRGINVDKIHEQIVDLVVKTVLSLIPDIMIWDHVTNRSKCVRSFQILGFDILLTSDLKAHLLEVNSSPSMGIDFDRETEPGSGIIESVTSVVDEQIKVPLLRDVLRLIAYGESEIDMKKSCLQRVYPPPLSSNHNLSLQPSRKPRSYLPRYSLSEQMLTKNLERLPLERLSMNSSKYEAEFSISSSRSMPGSISHDEIGVSNSEFDNPLLRSDVTPRQSYPAKRPKKFTIIKYKQEYAISTEEWRLFQLRSKSTSSSGIIKTSASQSRLTNSFFTPRLPPQTPSSPKTEPPKFSEETKDQLLCKICGHFLGGVGPGLLYAQEQHRISVEKNESEFDFQNDSITLSKSEEFLDIFKSQNRYSDWECGPPPPQITSLPPRSIFFDYAQPENDRLRHKFIPKERPFLLASDKTEVHDLTRNICNNCLESSTTSFVDEMNHDHKKRPVSTATPRGRLHSRPNFEHSEKTMGFDKKILRPNKFVIQDLLIIKRIASVFIYFNGFKPSLRISATSFRNMARKCRLCESGAMPAIDILFIDIMRQWQRQINDHTAPYYDTFRVKNSIISHQPPGLPFQGFLEAIFRIAKSRFKGASLKEKLEALVCNCERYMKEANKAANKISKKRKEIYPPKCSQMSSPRISGVMSARQPYF